MSLSEPDEQENVETHIEDGLYFGDTGVLPLDTRRVLVQLLSGPSLDEQRHTKLWPVLIRDENIIRKRLGDLFLELVIDPVQHVAFTRQANTDDIETPVLLRRSPLTFVDSVLLLYLRGQLARADIYGKRAVVTKEDIIEYLIPYEQTGSTDSAGFRKRVFASIEKMKERSILQKIRSSEDRFEISPALKLLFSAEEIKKLAALYKQMAADESSVENGEAADEELTL